MNNLFLPNYITINTNIINLYHGDNPKEQKTMTSGKCSNSLKWILQRKAFN